jgi:RNA polymerase sigma factor (sigma-70 family)
VPFPTTNWNMVLEAARPDARRSALSELCGEYWPPVYAFIQTRVRDPEQAKDLTQAFFLRLLEKHDLLPAHLERARFRSFLLASIRHFLSNNWDHERAQKRGGGSLPFSLDFDDGHVRPEPPDNLTPELIFERYWAATVVDKTLLTLRRESVAAGKKRQFDLLKECLTGDGELTYEEVGARLGKSAGAVKVEVYRMRRRFRELLRGAIAKTVADPADIDDELRYLFTVLCS